MKLAKVHVSTQEEMYETVYNQILQFMNIISYFESYNNNPFLKYSKLRILRYLINTRVIEMELNEQIPKEHIKKLDRFIDAFIKQNGINKEKELLENEKKNHL